MYRYTVLQAGTCTTGGGVGWSFGPYADGAWEQGIVETMTAASALIAPVAESVRDGRRFASATLLAAQSTME